MFSKYYWEKYAEDWGWGKENSVRNAWAYIPFLTLSHDLLEYSTWLIPIKLEHSISFYFPQLCSPICPSVSDCLVPSNYVGLGENWTDELRLWVLPLWRGSSEGLPTALTRHWDLYVLPIFGCILVESTQCLFVSMSQCLNTGDGYEGRGQTWSGGHLPCLSTFSTLDHVGVADKTSNPHGRLNACLI